MSAIVLNNQKNYLKILWSFLDNTNVVSVFKQFLFSPHKEIVLIAIEKAGESKNKEFISELLPFLDHSDRDIVLKSAVALIKLGEKQVIRSIERFIESKDITENCAAIRALSELEDKSTKKYLKKFINNTDDRIKKELIDSLARVHDETACKLALLELRRSNDKMFATSVKVLKNFGFYSDLIKLLYSKNETIRMITIAALKEIEIPDKKIEIEYQTALLKNIDENNEMLQLSAIGALSFSSEKALLKLIPKWKTIHPFYRKNIEEAIVRILSCDSNNFDVLYKKIESYTVDFIFSLFKKINDRNFLVLFRRAYNNEASFKKYSDMLSTELKQQKQLNVLKDKISVIEQLTAQYCSAPFLRKLRNELEKINDLDDIEFEHDDLDEQFIAVIIGFFSQLENRRINELLSILLFVDNQNIIESVIQAIGHLKLLDQAYLLENFISSNNTRQKISAIRTLGILKSEFCLKQINYCFNSKDNAIKREVLVALNNISGSRNVLLFYKALDDPSDMIKRTSVQILSAYPSKKTVEVLKSKIADVSKSVRIDIVKALIQLEDTDAYNVLIELLDTCRGENLKRAVDIACTLNEPEILKKLFFVIERTTASTQKKIIDHFHTRDIEHIEKHILPLCDEFIEKTKFIESSSGFTVPPKHIVDFFEDKDLTDVKEIAAGGMGKILRAYDRKNREYVAIKILAEKYKDDIHALRRFLKQDGYMVMELDHPNIIRVIEVNDKDIPYILMEYIDGKTIKTLIKEQGKLPESICKKLVYQVCKALEYAHNNNVIHRDIKPDNIMLDRKKKVKIMDFGLAKITGQTTMTRTGEIFGTIHYMPPEQIKKSYIDHKADIYALGVTFYEMLTGKFPYDGENPEQIIYQVFYDDIDLDPLYDNNISEQTIHVIRKCMEKELEDRYESATDILNDLGV